MDFVRYTAKEDLTSVTELYGGRKVPLNHSFSVPHDLGDPDDEPFVRANAYRIHDVSKWKDLALKFVVSCWRDASLPLGENDEALRRCREFVARECLPVCRQVMERASRWDMDGDGLVENSAEAPDQTYDTWRMDGPSSYCNSLWLAALRGFVEMAKGEKDVENYEKILEK